MNLIRTGASLALLALAPLLCSQPAQACEFARTQWGLRLTGCNLEELTRGRYDLAIDTTPPVPPIDLPNLVVTDTDVFIVGTAADLVASVANIGGLGAPGFRVLMIATITDPLNGGAGVAMTTLPIAFVASLAAGAGTGVRFGAIGLPNRAQDWDICLVAIVDPPQAGAPQGGVIESNESDNQWPTSPQQQGCCRVYGPKPDQQGPPACL